MDISRPFQVVWIFKTCRPLLMINTKQVQNYIGEKSTLNTKPCV